MEIYLLGTRMFMIMEVNESFSFEAKSRADQLNPKVREWETLMETFQKLLPQAKPGEKWLLMERVFKLEDYILTASPAQRASDDVASIHAALLDTTFSK